MEWSITHRDQRAVITRCGGGLRSYEARGRPTVDGYAARTRAPGGAGQVLAPWPNRIRDGVYIFEGRRHELTLTEPEHHNAIHGLTRNRDWELVDRTASSVTLQCTLVSEPGYPFHVSLVTTWSLSDEGLRATHVAEARGPGRAPFGLGVHPYLTVGADSVDDATLTVPADRALLTDDRDLPTDLIDITDNLDYRAAKAIGTAVLDQAFTCLTDDRTVRLSCGTDVVELWVGPSFPWVQVFTGDTLEPARRRRAVAVEPMSCPPDAFNTGWDLVTLDPGESWSGEWGIRRLG
jgi:aldose 1-epimerase